MGFSFSNLLEKIAGVGGKLSWVFQVLFGAIGPKLSAGELDKALAICDRIDSVADNAKAFTTHVRAAAADKQLTVEEIAALMDELSKVGAIAHAAETVAYQ